ncbi:MAG: hypothetical protein ACTSP3_07850 [Candidatus Heimdallarchaeaceae archaeon]
MTRNRLLFDFLGLIVAFAVAVPIIIFIKPNGLSGIAVTAGGILAGGFLLGFISFKNDGVKISAILCGLIALTGIVFGILMITGGQSIMGSIDNFVEAIVGPVIGITIIILGIIFMVALIVIGGLLIGVAAIGSVIGEAVWKDKQAILSKEDISYQPADQPLYQPVDPPKSTKPKAKVCPNCGVSNIGEGDFCTNCGAKLS